MKERFIAHCKFDTRKLVMIAILLALTISSAFLPAIPISPALQVTYQSFFSVLNGILLGAVWGAALQLIYLFMGLIGIPVFTKGGGFGYVMQPSFGYIIGFVFGAFVSGLIMDCFSDCKVWKVMVAAVVGTLAIYPAGVLYQYYAMISLHGMATSTVLGYLALTPFYLLGDSICLILIAFMPIKLLRKMTLEPKRARAKKDEIPIEEHAKDGSILGQSEIRTCDHETGDSCKVTLSIAGEQKIAVIKVLRELLSLGLLEAKSIAESTPHILHNGLESATAKEWQSKLEAVGATVILE